MLTCFGVLITQKNNAHTAKGKEDQTVATEHNIETEQSQIVQVVENANPAIVSIVVTKDMPTAERYIENIDPFNPFGHFFNRRFRFNTPQRQERRETEKKEVGGGSGFLVSKNGLVITNRHIIKDKNAEYTALANNGEKYSAKILATDNASDIAILKIEGEDFPYLEFGNSDALKPGQTVIAIGNALAEFHNSVSVGVVSGLSRSIVAGDQYGQTDLLEGVIQTDAAINPGNSGGPLLDITGKVIGVNVAVQQRAENIGFALPGNVVKSVAESVKEHGEIIKPFLGVRYIQVTKTLKERNNLPVDYGVLVIRGKTAEDLAVIPGSPADKAGITENDIILEIDDTKITTKTSLASIIRKKKINQKITLKIVHKNKEKKVEAVLEKAPKSIISSP